MLFLMSHVEVFLSIMFCYSDHLQLMLCPAAESLNEAGESFKQMAEIKFALEDNVKQNFLEPLTQLQNKDVRDVLVSVYLQIEYAFSTESDVIS